MKIAIMQPYLLPYIGYFQLINLVDKLVIYDNLKYTKKGWINRNRILMNGKEKLFSIPIKKDSNYKNIDERFFSENSYVEKEKIISQIENSYRNAPFFKIMFPKIKAHFMYNERNIFKFILNSLNQMITFLNIETEIIISSSLKINHELKRENKIIAICRELDANNYINPIGGVDLYDKGVFNKNGINLSFIKSRIIHYKQFDNEFIPWLSIIDVMMFNSTKSIQLMLKEYEII